MTSHHPQPLLPALIAHLYDAHGWSRELIGQRIGASTTLVTRVMADTAIPARTRGKRAAPSPVEYCPLLDVSPQRLARCPAATSGAGR